MLIPYASSEERTRAIMKRQLAAGLLFRAWDLELAMMLGLPIPAEPIDELVALWQAQTAQTPFPDGYGPWGRHPAWEEETYGIGHVRSLVRLLTNAGREVAHADALVGWLRSLQTPDGGFAAQEAFESLYRAR